MCELKVNQCLYCSLQTVCFHLSLLVISQKLQYTQAVSLHDKLL